MRTLLILLTFAVLGMAADPKPSYTPIDWSTVPKPGATGESAGELKDPKTGSSVIRYKIHAPDVLPAERHLGLIIAFHGLTGNEGAADGPYWAMKKLGLDGEYVIAGGKSLGNGWENADEARVWQFVDWLETIYPIDHRRVFLWGHSNGGWAVGTYGGHHPERIAGIVRWAGYGSSLAQAKDPAETLTEYYLVHGDADPTVKVPESRTLRQRLIAQKYRYVYREIKGGDHGSILSVEPVVADAARWVHALRHKTLPLPPDDLAFLKSFAKDKDPQVVALYAQPVTWDQLVRIGGPLAWQVVMKALKAKDAEVRRLAVAACAKTTFAGDETVTILTKLLDDEDPAVRLATITTLGVSANWHSATAQLALAKLALNQKTPSAERIAAATALAAALELPLLGNYSDDTVAFDGTIALLNTEPVELRALAFAPLKIAVPDGLGYDPTASADARKRPIADWQTWFAEHATIVAGKSAPAKK